MPVPETWLSSEFDNCLPRNQGLIIEGAILLAGEDQGVAEAKSILHNEDCCHELRRIKNDCQIWCYVYWIQ